MKNKSKELLLAELSKVTKDSQVVANNDLKALLDIALSDIDMANTDREVSSLAARLSQSIAFYLIRHKYDAPKSVIELGRFLAKYPNLTRGHLAPLQMLAQSLAGLRL